MQRYFDFALLWDLVIVVIIGSLLLVLKDSISDYLIWLSIDNSNAMGVSLITVSATLLGFLLTIITVIVTFKKGFEEKPIQNPNPKDSKEEPTETIFSKKISKADRFYSTPIHKRVVNVFVHASFEIGLVLLVLLIIQLTRADHQLYFEFSANLCALVALTLSIIRSLYIFKLFLTVHM